MDLILNANIPISGNRFKLEIDLKCLANTLIEKGFDVYICKTKHFFKDKGIILSSSNQRGIETNLPQIFYSSDWLLPLKFTSFPKPICERKIFDIICPNYFSFPEINKILDSSNFKSCSFSKIEREIKNHSTFAYKYPIWEEICSSKIVLIYGDNWHSLFEALWLKSKCVFLNCPKMREILNLNPYLEIKTSYDLEMALTLDLPLVEIPEEINRDFYLNLEKFISSINHRIPFIENQTFG